MTIQKYEELRGVLNSLPIAYEHKAAILAVFQRAPGRPADPVKVGRPALAPGPFQGFVPGFPNPARARHRQIIMHAENGVIFAAPTLTKTRAHLATLKRQWPGQASLLTGWRWAYGSEGIPQWLPIDGQTDSTTSSDSVI